MNRNKNKKKQSLRLTILLISLPLLVILLMVIFWVIFKETRKQIEITETPQSQPTAVQLHHQEMAHNQFSDYQSIIEPTEVS